MSSSNRRRDLSPPRGGVGGSNGGVGGGNVGSSKLRMDREPVVVRISGKFYLISNLFDSLIYKINLIFRS